MAPRHTPLAGTVLVTLLVVAVPVAAAGSMARAAADTFYLYGGPGTLEGTFQTAEGAPDTQGWMGFDRTNHLDYWQVSTHNAQNLNDHGPDNHAMWCGQTAEQQPGWVAPPGYGNSWDEALEWSAPVPDAGDTTEVTLEFAFNYSSEPGYDGLSVQWNAGGTWTTLAYYDGTNATDLWGGTFHPPGAQFLQTWTVPPDSYVGSAGDTIELRLHFSSDGAWSAEDGLFPLPEGACQVDDIRVAFDGDVVSTADFEPGGSDGGWAPGHDLVGDFSKVFAGLTDLDPCAENITPQFTFIDDGTPPNNAPGQSTGGTLNPDFDYGVPGGWVVNDNGGLREDGSGLDNEIRSPVIPFDLPGSEDDPPGMRTLLTYEVYEHHCCYQPAETYRMRTSGDGGATWSAWDGPSFVFFAPAPIGYRHRVHDLSADIPAGTTHLQIALTAGQSPFFGLNFTTPAPFYDNVKVFKQRSGPVITFESRFLPQDGFPRGVPLDVSTPAARDALDIPLSRFDGGVPVRVNLRPVDAGEILDPAEQKLVWVLEQNPRFEPAIRQLPPAATNLPPSARGWHQVTGEVTAVRVGAPSAHEFDFTLPDVDFLYPGDVFRFYIRAQAADGSTSTFPADLTEFDHPEARIRYDREFVVRGLPTLTGAQGDHPPLLVLDYSSDANAHPLVHDLAQLGRREGLEYDTFHPRRRDEDSGIGGTAHGATVDQLAGYTCVVGVGRLSQLQTGDVQVLLPWHDAAGDRLAVWFFDSFEFFDLVGFEDAWFDRLGAQRLDLDVAPSIGGQTSPTVVAELAPFATSFVARGGCPTLRTFARIGPWMGGTVGHGFAIAGGGATHPGVSASVVHDRSDGGHRVVDVTFPFPLEAMVSPAPAPPDGRSVRAQVLEEAFAILGTHDGGPPTAAETAPRRGVYDLAVAPNPFNPKTTVSFVLGQQGACTVSVLDLQGKRVATLARGILPAGRHEIGWQGKDDGGRTVASGTYVVQVDTPGGSVRRKLALIK